MRLSLLMRCPLHEVMTWPLWVVRSYAEFLGKEPMPEERTEIQVAQLSSLFAAVHRQPGAPAPRAADYLLFRDAWADEMPDAIQYSNVDLQIMRQLQR